MAGKENSEDLGLHSDKNPDHSSGKDKWYRDPVKRFFVVLILILILLSGLVFTCVVVWTLVYAALLI